MTGWVGGKTGEGSGRESRRRTGIKEMESTGEPPALCRDEWIIHYAIPNEQEEKEKKRKGKRREEREREGGEKVGEVQKKEKLKTVSVKASTATVNKPSHVGSSALISEQHTLTPNKKRQILNRKVSEKIKKGGRVEGSWEGEEGEEGEEGRVES